MGSEVGAGISPAYCDVYAVSMHSWPICWTASDRSWTCSEVMPLGTPSIEVQFMQMLNCSKTAPWHAVERASCEASAANTLLYVSQGVEQTSGIASTGKGARVRSVGVAAATGARQRERECQPEPKPRREERGGGGLEVTHRPTGH